MLQQAYTLCWSRRQAAPTAAAAAPAGMGDVKACQGGDVHKGCVVMPSCPCAAVPQAQRSVFSSRRCSLGSCGMCWSQRADPVCSVCIPAVQRLVMSCKG